MWFLSALTAVLCWGGADLFYKKSSSPEISRSHLKIVSMVGLLMGAHALYALLTTDETFLLASIVTYLPVSALYIASMTMGYLGMRYLELSVCSPVCNTSGAVAALLCAVFLGMSMSGWQLVAVCVMCAGVVLLAALEDKPQAAFDKKFRSGAAAILLPVAYSLLDGAGTFADAVVLENGLSEFQALVSYELTFFICGLAAFLYVHAVKKEPLSASVKGALPRAGAAALETVGQVFYVSAMAENAVVAAPMIASYSAVSVLLSRLVLKERLKKTQYAVVCMVMLGIALLGYLEEVSP